MTTANLTAPATAVIEFYASIGFTPKDRTVIGGLRLNEPRNTILDIPRFLNKVDVFICIHPLKGQKLKANVVRVFTCYADLDFKDFDVALAHIEKIKAILDRLGFFYGIVHSGRGLHVYLPVGEVGKNELVELNIHLNSVILAEYFENGIIDRKLIQNYSTFLRLPETINSKNGKRTFIAFQNFDQAVEDSIDHSRHNYQIILESIRVYESNRPARTTHQAGAKSNGHNNADTRELDYRYGFFRWRLFDHIIQGTGDFEEIREIIDVFRAAGEDRELNNSFFPNLAVYIKKSSPNEDERKRFTDNAKRFINQISTDPDDPPNLQRWLDRYDELEGTKDEMELRSKQLLNWAEREFPNTIVHMLIKDDSDRLYRHRAYFSFLQENMNGESIQSMRGRWADFVQKNIEKPEFHWGVLETGIGKTDLFLRYSRDGKRIVFLTPYLMLKFDIERKIGWGSVFTLDSVRGGEKAHKQRQELMFALLDADIVVVDEAHCVDLHFRLKPEIMIELNQFLERVAREKPVFMLSGTPSVNQILTIEREDTSKIVSYLRKDLKRIKIGVIDQQGLKAVFEKHERILIFIDDKRQIVVLQEYIQNHITTGHEILPIHSEISTVLKKRTEEEIRECPKWVIIGTSSVVSGINIDGLDTIVFSNRIMNQQNLYQCMGRLRIVNKLERVHPIYIINMTDFRNPRADLDMFEFVSPAAIIRYLSKLYHVQSIASCDPKITSFNRLRNFEDWKTLIRSVSSIKDYYAHQTVQEKSLYAIPMQIMRELSQEGFFTNNPNWLNVPIKSVLYTKYDQPNDHAMKIETRSPHMGVRNPIWHYVDPKELSDFIEKQQDKEQFIKHLNKRMKMIVQKIIGNSVEQSMQSFG